MTLTEFLLARIAEDEAAARAATPGPWRWTGDYPSGHCPHGTEWTNHGPNLESATATVEINGNTYAADVITSGGYDASSLTITDADAAFIAGRDPARVLADCEAKRRIVAMESGAGNRASEHDWGNGWDDAHLEVLRLLAVPYADHPDYDEAWRV